MTSCPKANTTTVIASNETLLDQLSFVGDAKEEAELVKKELAEKHRTEIEAVEDMAAGGGY